MTLTRLPSAGPERWSLGERFVAFFPLPYPLACILIAFLIAVPMVFLVLLPYITSGNQVWQVFTLWTLFSFYSFYAPYYMRRRVLDTERSILSLLPRGEQDFHKYFGEISALKPQLAVWIMFAAAAGWTFARLPSPRPEIYGPMIVLDAVITLGLASTFWIYISSLKGIHLISPSLELAPYYEDRMLGLKPLGSLALSLAIAYFGGLSLATFLTFFSSDLQVIGLNGIMILLGLVAFFLPLWRLHQRMLQKKSSEREKLKDSLARTFQDPAQPGSSPELNQLFILDMIDRKVSSISTWPFDVSILGKLTTIVLSITAIMLSKIISILLQIQG